MKSSTFGALVAVFVILTLSYFFSNSMGSHDQGHGGHGHHQHQAAPHGGSLAVLGDKKLHLEILFDGEKGELLVYILGPQAREVVSIEQPHIEVKIPAVSSQTLKLQSAGSSQEGETKLWRSPYTLKDQRLEGVFHLDIEIVELVIDGVSYPPIAKHLH